MLSLLGITAFLKGILEARNLRKPKGMKVYWVHAVTLQSLHSLLHFLKKARLVSSSNPWLPHESRTYLIKSLDKHRDLSHCELITSCWEKLSCHHTTGRVRQRQAYKLGPKEPWQADNKRKEQSTSRTKEWSQPDKYRWKQGNLKTRVINPPQIGGLLYSSCSQSKEWFPKNDLMVCNVATSQT